MSYTINRRTFVERFEQFRNAVKAAAGGEPFRSFGTGLPRRWERYKDAIYDDGRIRLGFEDWKQDEVGSGTILRQVIKAIEISVVDENQRERVRNNLVRWDSRFGPNRRSHRSLYEALDSTTERFAYESLLYDFYRDELAPEDAFGSLVEQAGRLYDFIAYLFFLKDWTHYLPISPENFDTAFSLLDVGLKTSGQCSWENYGSYLAVLRQIRDALRDEGLDDVRLIDAHSFCYMLAKLELPAAPPRVALVPEPLGVLLAAGTAVKALIATTPAGDRPIVDFDQQRNERAALGRLAEDIALDAERERLTRAGRGDLAARIAYVGDDHTKGYDIKSFDEDGTDRFIEVKAVRVDEDVVSFFLTENERRTAARLSNYFYYLVIGARTEGRAVKYIRAEECLAEFLRPVVHIASIPVQVRQESDKLHLPGPSSSSA